MRGQTGGGRWRGVNRRKKTAPPPAATGGRSRGGWWEEGESRGKIVLEWYILKKTSFGVLFF